MPVRPPTRTMHWPTGIAGNALWCHDFAAKAAAKFTLGRRCMSAPPLFSALIARSFVLPAGFKTPALACDWSHADCHFL